MVFGWATHARKALTIDIIPRLRTLRPDMYRLKEIFRAGEPAGAQRAWDAHLDSNKAGYQIPGEIPWDRTFVFSPSEARYVDQAAAYLFGVTVPTKDPVPLIRTPELYVFPLPFRRTRAKMAAVKAEMSITRIFSLATATKDLPVHRDPAFDAKRVTRDVRFVPGWEVEDFPKLPPIVRESFPCPGVQVLLPYVLKYF